MTLKELRLKANLIQQESAKYLKISLRCYQNYEKNIRNINETKYNLYCNLLQEYINNKYSNNVNFNLNIITGNKLLSLYQNVKDYNKRYCYNQLIVNKILKW